MTATAAPLERVAAVLADRYRIERELGQGGMATVYLAARRRFVGRFPSATDYDLSPDGRTFIVVRPIRAVADVIVAVHWADEARQDWTATAGR